MRKQKTLLSLVAIFLFVAMVAVAHAAIPPRINYQGYITNQTGAPVTGTVTMVFALYDTSSGGSPLWTETQSVVVAQGVYSVILGSSTDIGLAFDKDYYLGITVGSDSEMTPRQMLTSVGYAFMAENAGSAATADRASSAAEADRAASAAEADRAASAATADRASSSAEADRAASAATADHASSSAQADRAILADTASSLSGILGISNGGTGASSAGDARSAFGAAASGSNSDITSLSGLTTPLSIEQGGTGSASKVFVDLTSDETIEGTKIFAPGADAPGLIIRQSAVTPATSDIFSIEDRAGAIKFFAIGGDGTIRWSGALSGDGSNLTNINPARIAAGTANINITGTAASAANATTSLSVINGVYTSGRYADPQWITQLAASKISGNVADPSWITSLSGSKVSGNISGSAGNVSGIVAVANGGTGGANATAARGKLGAAASGANGDITSLTGLSAQAAITIRPFGTVDGNTGELRFMELSRAGLQYVGFKAPDAISTSVVWTLPESDGEDEYVLATDGSGHLSWRKDGVEGMSDVVHGCVTRTGTAFSGEGFTAKRTAKGIYAITFDSPFSSMPTINVTPRSTDDYGGISAGWNCAGNPTSGVAGIPPALPTENCALNGFVVNIREKTEGYLDNDFCFTAME